MIHCSPIPQPHSILTTIAMDTETIPSVQMPVYHQKLTLKQTVTATTLMPKSTQMVQKSVMKSTTTVMAILTTKTTLSTPQLVLHSIWMQMEMVKGVYLKPPWPVKYQKAIPKWIRIVMTAQKILMVMVKPMAQSSTI